LHNRKTFDEEKFLAKKSSSGDEFFGKSFWVKTVVFRAKPFIFWP
jgi:hypothetical protein